MSNNGFNEEILDLGSTPLDDDFDPFAGDEDFSDDEVKEDLSAKNTTSSKSRANVFKAREAISNPIVSAVDKVETKEAEKAQQSLYDRLPIFEYAGATESIDDTAKTFDELCIQKAIHFPELEDGKRVSWAVEYGKIAKTITDVKGTTIGKIKSEIETSKEFADILKKAKDKNIVCKLKPRVTAQSKGYGVTYKDVFTNMDEAESAGKVISIVPARDGKVYEIRNTEMGRFITPVNNCELLSDIRAGFIPALPPIPHTILLDIISFFRNFMRYGPEKEALINIYWDKFDRKYIANPPKQVVSKISVMSELSDEFNDKRYIHYMDVHSHNSMKAFFSQTDNADEKATRLYSVIGRLDKYFPEIKVRMSNGGKHMEIDLGLVFEQIYDGYYPNDWANNVVLRDGNLNDDTVKETFDKYFTQNDGDNI